MAVIAMTREMGTLGKDVAAGVAERLKLTVVHHELVEHGVAAQAGLNDSEVHRFLEGEASLLERWRLDRARMSRFTAQEILELAVKGNVLIRGWGAAYLLRAIPHVVCVRICAPMAFRADVMMKRLGLADRAAAQREIERNDAAHNGMMQRLFAANWTDPSLYAVSLNTQRIPPADCVDHIVRLAESAPFRETPEARTKLMDQLIEARVRSALGASVDASLYAVGIDVTVENGKVILSGAMSDERVIADVVRRVHTVAGVTGVESRIQHLTFARGFG